MIELNGFCTDKPFKFDRGMTEEDFRSEVIKCLQNQRDDLDTSSQSTILLLLLNLRHFFHFFSSHCAYCQSNLTPSKQKKEHEQGNKSEKVIWTIFVDHFL